MGTNHSPRRVSPTQTTSPTSMKPSTNGVAMITLEARGQPGASATASPHNHNAHALNKAHIASSGTSNRAQLPLKASPHGLATGGEADADDAEEKLPSISRIALQHITHAAATTTTAPRLPSRESTDTGHHHHHHHHHHHRGRSPHRHASGGVMPRRHARNPLTSAASSGTRSSAHKKIGSPPPAQHGVSPPHKPRLSNSNISQSSAVQPPSPAGRDAHAHVPLHRVVSRRHSHGSKSHSPARRRSQHRGHSSAGPGRDRTQAARTPTRSASQHPRGHLYRGHPQPLHTSDPGSTRTGSAPSLGKKLRSRSTKPSIKLPTLRAERFGRSSSVEEDVTPHDRFLERKQELHHTRQARQSLTHATHRVPQRYMMVGYRASLANRQQMSEEELLHLQRLAIAPAPDLYFGKGISGSVPQLHRRHFERAQLRGRLASKEIQIHGVAMDTPGHHEGQGAEAADERLIEEEEQDVQEALKEEEEEEDMEQEGRELHEKEGNQEEDGVPIHVDYDDDDDDVNGRGEADGEDDDNVSTVTSLHTEMSQLLMAKEDAHDGTGMRFGRISTGWEGTDLDPAQAQLEAPEPLKEADEEAGAQKRGVVATGEESKDGVQEENERATDGVQEMPGLEQEGTPSQEEQAGEGESLETEETQGGVDGATETRGATQTSPQPPGASGAQAAGDEAADGRDSGSENGGDDGQDVPSGGGDGTTSDDSGGDSHSSPSRTTEEEHVQ